VTNGTKWNPLELQAEFCKAMDIPLATRPEAKQEDYLFLGRALIMEEFKEVMIEYDRIEETALHWIDETERNSLRHQFLQNLCAELADLIYVICQAANMHGLPLAQFYDAIHAANMQKIDPVTGKVTRREDGKVLKPIGWQPPPLTEIYDKARRGFYDPEATDGGG